MPALQLTLKAVFAVDFRHGVPFHYDDLLKRKRLAKALGLDETIVLVSQTGLQIAFVFGEEQITSRSGEPVKVIASYRLQLARHTPWSPLMLSEYAAKAGLVLEGVKRFEDYIKGKTAKPSKTASDNEAEVAPGVLRRRKGAA